MAETLRSPHKYPNEYYLWGNNGLYLTGRAKVRDAAAFRDLVVPTDTMIGYVSGHFTVAEATAEALDMLTPRDGKVGQVPAEFFAGSIRIVEIIRHTRDDGRITVKACLQNRDTGGVVLLTTSNFQEGSQVKAKTAGWFILNCGMLAPGGFWNAIKMRLVNRYIQ